MLTQAITILLNSQLTTGDELTNTLAAKIYILAHFVLYALTSSNIDRFSKIFHSQNQENICNNTVTKDPTTRQVCEMSVS